MLERLVRALLCKLGHKMFTLCFKCDRLVLWSCSNKRFTGVIETVVLNRNVPFFLPILLQDVLGINSYSLIWSKARVVLKDAMFTEAYAALFSYNGSRYEQ